MFWGFSNQKGRKGKGSSSNQARAFYLHWLFAWISSLSIWPHTIASAHAEVRGGSLAVGRFGVQDDPVPWTRKLLGTKKQSVKQSEDAEFRRSVYLKFKVFIWVYLSFCLKQWMHWMHLLQPSLRLRNLGARLRSLLSWGDHMKPWKQFEAFKGLQGPSSILFRLRKDRKVSLRIGRLSFSGSPPLSFEASHCLRSWNSVHPPALLTSKLKAVELRGSV